MQDEQMGQKLREEFWSDKRCIFYFMTDCGQFYYFVVMQTDILQNKRYYIYISHEYCCSYMHVLDPRHELRTLSHVKTNLMHYLYRIFDGSDLKYDFAKPIFCFSHNDDLTKLIEKKFDNIKKEDVKFMPGKEFFAQFSINGMKFIDKLYFGETDMALIRIFPDEDEEEYYDYEDPEERERYMIDLIKSGFED